MNNQTLKQYTNTWKSEYQIQISQNPLFKESFVKSLTQSQKEVFCKALYHIRGNFYKFFWYLGSLSASLEQKQIIMRNIEDEFGAFERLLSHEQLYYDFAEELGVDIKKEIIDEEYNYDWIKQFNFAPIKLVLTKDYDTAWSAFCAYEMLDNVDYNYLFDVGKNLGLSKKALKFFLVHTGVTHFEETEEILEKLWNSNKQNVIDGFDFVFQKQLGIWKKLYELVASTF